MKAFRYIFGLLLAIIFQPQVSANVQEEDSLRELLIIEEGYRKAELYYHVSRPYRSSDIDSVNFYAEQAKLASLNEKDYKGIARASLKLGIINLRLDKTIPAREQFHIALDNVKKCECDSLEASIYLYLGKSYIFHDNYSEAIINYLNSLYIAEEINDLPLLSELYDEIGLVLAYLEDYDQAIGYLNKALEIDNYYGYKRNHATTLRYIGFILLHQKKYMQAKDRYIESLKLYEEINYFYGRAASTLGIGNIEFAMENYQIALDFYLTALELANKHNDKYEFSGSAVKAIVYNRLGETYLKLGYLKESANMLKIAADLSDEFDIPANMAKTSLLYSQLYERIKNSELAYQYFKTYNELTDSIINARNVATITKLEMEYQYMKKQKVMSLQQLKKEEEHKRKVLLYELMIGVTVVIMALLILILILYRKNQRGKAHEAELIKINLVLEKENLQKELDFKNKELTTSVMYQLKKNNFIWKISEKLKGIALNLTPENRKSVKSIVKEMEGNMSKESWEEFEFRFNEVHNDFYDNLLRDFPDLTPNELKLCAFLKLNMTTKDIATITYQSTHSITVARYRLRNKLKLERDENLVSFLSKF